MRTSGPLNMDPVTVTFTLGEREYLRTSMRIYQRKRLPIYLVILAAYAFFILRIGSWPRAFVDLRVLMLIAFAAFMFLLAPLLVRRGLAKAFRSNKRIQEELRFTFTPEGYTIVGETFTGDNQWAGLHRVQETRDMFLFYHSTLTMNLVPKRAFNGPANIETIRGFVRNAPGLQFKQKS